MIEFFAEIGSNHNQDLNRAFELISYARSLNFNGVKFQYFKADTLWHESKVEERKAAKENELQLEWVPLLSGFAKENDMLFGLSVFDVNGVVDVCQYCDYLKIASFEAGYMPLVVEVFKRCERVMISTGQISKDEIFSILSNLPLRGRKIDILHCVSKYPARIEDLNIRVIADSKGILNGYSDHSVTEAAIYSAIACGATVIEMHLDLPDRAGVETGHSWSNPEKLMHVIKVADQVETAVGNLHWDDFILAQNFEYKANPVTGRRGE